MDSSTPGFSVLHYLPEFSQIHVDVESMMPSNHLILCYPLSSCPQSFQASWSSPMSQLFASGGQSIGASALASVLPMGFPGDSADKESTCNTGDWVESLGWEDPLEKGKATHSSILAWGIPQRVGHKELDMTERHSLHFQWIFRVDFL